MTTTSPTTLNYIIQRVVAEIPGVPDTLASMKAQDAMIDFYRRSTGWRADLEVNAPSGMVSGQSTYALNPVDANTQLLFVLGAYLYPSVAGGQSRKWLYPQTRQVVGPDSDLPTTFFMSAPDQMVLYPVPNQNYGAQGVGLYVYAILMPSPTGTLPTIATNDHLDGIVFGTLFRLYMMPKRPWSDPALGAQYRRWFLQETMRVRDEANRAYSGADSPLRFPAFARGSQGIMSGTTAVAR